MFFHDGLQGAVGLHPAKSRVEALDSPFVAGNFLREADVQLPFRKGRRDEFDAPLPPGTPDGRRRSSVPSFFLTVPFVRALPEACIDLQYAPAVAIVS